MKILTIYNIMAGKSILQKIRVIDVRSDVKKEIAAELGCNIQTVYNALNLSNPTIGEQPDRIRMMARARGGVESTRNRWIRL